MKKSEHSKAIRSSKSRYRQMMLADDVLPGTPLDREIYFYADTIQSLDYGREIGEAPPCFRESYSASEHRLLSAHTLQEFGEIMARAILNRDSTLFREYADALDAFKNHKRELRCPIRKAVLRFCLYPRSYTMREIIKHLVEAKIIPKGYNSDDYDGPRMTVRRIAQQCGIKISGHAGRPPKTRTKTRKKAASL
jgi:hypothetical protein